VRYAGDYDHKYSYSRVGYNLKASDFQAAVGVAQLDRLEGFIARRRHNWQTLYNGLKDLPIEIIQPAPNTIPSWFGFGFMTDRRHELQLYLNSKNIGNRPIMGGNLLRQKAFMNIDCEIIGSLDGANRIHEQGLYIGVTPIIDDDMLDYVIENMRAFYA
jgi:CDP-6-deoxy-D-xylo-4-hexulose-3-dehydrase